MANFTKHWIGSKFKDLGNFLTETIVSFDPEGASEAQIAAFEEQIQKLARGVVDAENELQKDEDAAKGYQTSLERFMAAAEHLNGQVEAAGGEDSADANIVAALNEALERAEEAAEELKFAEEQRDDSRAFVKEKKALLASGQAKLKDARKVLRNASRKMERASQRQERAERRSTGGDGFGSNSALDAMTRVAQEAENKARATELATGDASGGTSDALQAALEATNGVPKPKSAAERLASLRR